ncbi:MAG: diacylglycerol kinase family protein [Zymomonas mobilis]|uniref:diacylglycerol/lipid kinase family protein n=1 Tax=Zymomonas mobilis TaxID=542 RepID=UPI0039ECE93E
MVNQRIAVIVNPTAGKRRHHSVQRFVDYLEKAGCEVLVEKTCFQGHATELARELADSGEYTHIVAAGGDGTIAEVAEGVIGSDVILCVLPIGTANVFARELSIAFNEIQNAADIIKGHWVRLWPACLFNDGKRSLSIQMIGIGIDAHIVHHISSRLKRMIGKTAYLFQTIRSLWQYPFYEMLVSVEGRATEKATAVIISKGAFYAGNYRLLPWSKQKEKAFSVLLFQSPSKMSYLYAVAAFFMGKIADCKHIKIVKAEKVKIEANPRIPIQSDGDARGCTPATIEISTKALKVAIPA